MPWHERTLERAAARVLGSERTWGRITNLLRFFQRPLAKDGSIRLPARLNPAGPRQLPALARKSFRDMWQDGEVQ
jgi:hypothetical protein